MSKGKLIAMHQKPSQFDPFAVRLEGDFHSQRLCTKGRKGVKESTHKRSVAAPHILYPYLRIRSAFLPSLYRDSTRSDTTARLNTQGDSAMPIGDTLFLQDYIVTRKGMRTAADLETRLRPRYFEDGMRGVGRYQNCPC